MRATPSGGLEMEAIVGMTVAARSVRRLALGAVVSFTTACAVERHLVLEVRELGSQAPVRNAQVQITFVSRLRLGPYPPGVHLQTDVEGRAEAKILFSEPAFHLEVFSDALPAHRVLTAEDRVLDGQHKEWSADWRLRNGGAPLLEWRLWFDTKSGSRSQ
jgi:hypothetical protein